MLKALLKLYENLGMDCPLEDYMNDYLSENMARNGRTALWYLDESHNVAIYTDDCTFLTEEEIESELC